MSDQIDILMSFIDIIHRCLSEDELTRYDIYNEIMNVFDEDVVADALGDDPIFDKVYREFYLGHEPDDDEDK